MRFELTTQAIELIEQVNLMELGELIGRVELLDTRATDLYDSVEPAARIEHSFG